MQPDEPTQEDSFVDELLTPGGEECGTDLRERLLDRTSRHLRFRRRIRNFGKLGVVAAAFAAGLILTPLLREPNVVERMVIVQVPVESESHGPANPQDMRRLTPAEVELEAERTLAKDESSRLFREAGDRYLNEEQNHEAALRCYRNFLDEAGEADLPVADSDTWLLTSLKNARLREIKNVP